MIRYFLILVNTFVLSLLLLACAPEIYRPKVVTVSEENNGDTVYLQTGDALEVVLESNPTTGYQWEPLGDVSPYLSHSGEPVYAPDGDEIGAGGKMTFAYEATGAGQTQLELVYRQPFDLETPPIETFGLTVIIID